MSTELKTKVYFQLLLCSAAFINLWLAILQRMSITHKYVYTNVTLTSTTGPVNRWSRQQNITGDGLCTWNRWDFSFASDRRYLRRKYTKCAEKESQTNRSPSWVVTIRFLESQVILIWESFALFSFSFLQNWCSFKDFRHVMEAAILDFTLEPKLEALATYQLIAAVIRSRASI